MPMYGVTPGGDDQTERIRALLDGGGAIDFAPETWVRTGGVINRNVNAAPPAAASSK